MAGNIGVELYLAVGEFKLGLPNFNPLTVLDLNLLKRGFLTLNTMTLYKFFKIEKCQSLHQLTLPVRLPMKVLLLTDEELIVTNHCVERSVNPG